MLKRIVKPTVDYLKIAERVPTNQELNFIDFQKRHQKYLLNFHKYPANAPQIDWNYYRDNISNRNHSIIDELKLAYDRFTIPYPKDELTKLIDHQIGEVQNDIYEFKELSNKRIIKYECEKNHLENMIPVSEMTIEEYCEFYPDDGPDFINRPTFWPHTPEDRLLENPVPSPQ